MKQSRDNTNTLQILDYATITVRVKTVSCSKYCHPTDVFKPVNGILTFPPTTKAVL